jgi:hypothetical protein
MQQQYHPTAYATPHRRTPPPEPECKRAPKPQPQTVTRYLPHIRGEHHHTRKSTQQHAYHTPSRNATACAHCKIYHRIEARIASAHQKHKRRRDTVTPLIIVRPATASTRASPTR